MWKKRTPQIATSSFVHCAFAKPCMVLNKMLQLELCASFALGFIIFKWWFSMDGGQAKFTENLRVSPFNREIFIIQIYLDGQYL
jgi:hypothetical protein